MSSILDALRKLEAEKAEANPSPAGIVDEVAAADELLGRGARRKGVASRLGTNTLIAGGALLIVALLAIAIVYPTVMMRDSAKPVTAIAQAVSEPATSPAPTANTSQQSPVTQLETLPAATPVPPAIPVAPPQADAPVAPAVPLPVPTVQNHPVQPAPTAAPQPALPSQSQSAGDASAETPSAAKPPPEPSAQKAAPHEPDVIPPAEPVVTKPEPAPEKTVAPTPPPGKTPEAPGVDKVVDSKEKEIAAPERTKEPEPRESDATILAKADPPPAPKEDSPAPVTKRPSPRSESTITPRERKTEPVSVFSLPVLRDSDKERYGLKDVRINMLLPATKTRPLASAIINLQTVYVGETIPGSQAVLIGVEARGLAIEIEGNGQQYHIRF